MRLNRPFAVMAMLAVFAAASRAAEVPRYVQPSDIDWASILPGPPPDDSPDHTAEVAQMLYLQASRTTADVIRCRSEADITFAAFADVLGDDFKERLLPQTAALLQQVQVDNRAVLADAKKNWNRVRPRLADPRIHPCVKLKSEDASYPSAHASQGIIWASILSEIYPDHRDQLMARGEQIGQDRIIGGVHYPSDVRAGRQIGEAIVKKLMDNSDFQVALEQAKEECQATSH
jgi:acid phosphatase (class A)